MNLIERIYEEMTTDSDGNDKQAEILHDEYMKATVDQQKAIDRVFIALCGWSLKTLKLLVKNSNYVLLRRFSAKEENQRIVAAPYISSAIKSNMIGLENHLNYIYRPQGELSIEEVFGLAALYNCKLFDIYFRTFSGNTQVSATEIKGMPLPELHLIKKIGSLLLKSKLRYNQLDEIIQEVIAGSNYPLSL